MNKNKILISNIKHELMPFCGTYFLAALHTENRIGKLQRTRGITEEQAESVFVAEYIEVGCAELYQKMMSSL